MQYLRIWLEDDTQRAIQGDVKHLAIGVLKRTLEHKRVQLPFPHLFFSQVSKHIVPYSETLATQVNEHATYLQFAVWCV